MVSKADQEAAAEALRGNITRLRKQQGLTQRALGKAAGMANPDQTMSDFMARRQDQLDYAFLLPMAKALDAELRDLFTIHVPQSDIVTSSVTAVRTNPPSTPTKGDGVHGTSGDQVGSLTRQLADRDQTIRALRVALSAHAKELKELSGKLAHLAGASRQHVRPSARRKPKAG